jgi:hypothetical protein
MRRRSIPFARLLMTSLQEPWYSPRSSALRNDGFSRQILSKSLLLNILRAKYSK